MSTNTRAPVTDEALLEPEVTDRRTGVEFMPGASTSPALPAPPASPAEGAETGIETPENDGV